MNHALAQIEAWISNCCMSINPSKSTVLHVSPADTQERLEYGAISINGKAVEVVACLKFLGVIIIDDKISGADYFSALNKCLFGAIAAFVRARHLLPTESLLLLYHAFFASFLAHGIEAFGLNTAKFLRPVQLLQKEAVRIIAKAGPRDHTFPIFSSSRIIPYLSLMKYNVCVLIHNIITDGAQTLLTSNCPQPRQEKVRPIKHHKIFYRLRGGRYMERTASRYPR